MKKLLLTGFALPLSLAFGAMMMEPVPAAADTATISASELPAGISARSARKIARANKKPSNSGKGLASVCKSTAPLRGALLKNAYPGHISRSDPRAPGFAFVCGSDCPRSFPAKAYYSDGTLAFSLGYYGRWEGNGQPRAYCGAGGAPMCSVSTVTNGSRASKRDGKVYISFGNGSCRSAVPGQRTGSTGA